MSKRGGYATSSPLARMLADKREAAEARARLVQRLKPSAAPLPVPVESRRDLLDPPGDEPSDRLADAVEPVGETFEAPEPTANIHFPQTALEALDVDRALVAWRTLSKRGFDRVRGWRDVRDAKRYARSLGYAGPDEEVEGHLLALIDLRRKSLRLLAGERIGVDEPGHAAGDPSGSGRSWTVDRPDLSLDAVGAASRPRGDDPNISSLSFDGENAPPKSVDGLARGGADPAKDAQIAAFAGSLRAEGAVSAATVADLLGSARISVRLFNVSRNSPMFGEWTVASALARRDEFVDRLWGLRNIGRKTVDEVTALLDEVSRSQTPDAAGAEEPRAHAELDSIVLATTLTETLRAEKNSPTLAFALSRDVFGSLTVKDYLVDRENAMRGFDGLPAFASDASMEACALLDRILGIAISGADAAQSRSALVAPGLSEALDQPIGTVLHSRPLSTRLANIVAGGGVRDLKLKDFIRDRHGFGISIREIGNSGRVTAEEADRILGAHVESLQDRPHSEANADAEQADGPDAATRLEPLAPRERLLNAIQALPEREAQVLRWRYGIEGGRARTLQDIADEVYVTRQYVSQVEQRAIRRLQKGPGENAVAAVVEAEQQRQWTILAGRAPGLAEDLLSERFRGIDPLFALAVDVGFGGARNWLDSFAIRQTGGWVRDAKDAARRAALAESIARIARDFPTPMPPARLLQETGEPIDGAVLDSLGVQGCAIVEGYLCTGFLGSRAKRAVRLHLIAGMVARGGLFDIGSLARAYLDLCPEDDVGSRVIQKEIDEAPHLFAPLFDGIWLMLPPASQDMRLDAPPFERNVYKKEHEFSEESASARILRFLEASGPQRLVDIADHATSDGETSRGGVASTLATIPCFRRVAPGFYGLYRADEEVRERLHPSLLNETQCRFYCLARHSGAPADYYPGWGVDFEMELAHWAEAHAPSELFRSLLWVIEPGGWPIPADLAAEILVVKSREGRWSIGSERSQELGRRFIDPDQFLAILAHLAIFGWIGWFAVNRLTGGTTTQGDADDILAFLAVVGLVDAPCDWQARHSATPRASRLFLDAAERRHRIGRLAWDDELLGPIMDGMETPTASLGWIGAREAGPAIEGWRSGRLPVGRANRWGGGTTQPDVEETFASPEWETFFGRAS